MVFSKFNTRPTFEYRKTNLSAVWPIASYFTSLSLSFSIKYRSEENHFMDCYMLLYKKYQAEYLCSPS